jgi:glycosyltransferase involved in cell wall biosynthesis
VKILILTFYYPPDIGPGPLRAKSLVDALLKYGLEEVDIDVLTTMPNRYITHGVKAASFEAARGTTIKRFDLPVHRSGMVDQAKAFLAYAKAIIVETKGQQYDVVLATSSRLMTAVLGALVAKRVNAKLYLDIRDIFTDVMEDILVGSFLRFMMPSFRVLERWAFNSADKINVVSAGFLPEMQRIVPSVMPSVFTNGIDEEFIVQDFSSHCLSKPPLVLYAGNIGEGQGLHNIVPIVAAATIGTIQFSFLGDGGRRKVLQERLDEKALGNVNILDPVPRSDLFEYYRKADVLFLHLNDFKAFHKVLPSKIFEYAATGKPILAGVSGYAAEFLKENVPGVEVFEPCNVEGMIVGLNRLLSGPRKIDRPEFCAKFRRQFIMYEMAADIFSMADINSTFGKN